MIGNFLRKIFNSKTGILKTERFLTPNELSQLTEVAYETRDLTQLILRTVNALENSTVKPEFANDDEVQEFAKAIHANFSDGFKDIQEECISICMQNAALIQQSITETKKLPKHLLGSAVAHLPIAQEQQEIIHINEIMEIQLENVIDLKEQILEAQDFLNIPEIAAINNEINVVFKKHDITLPVTTSEPENIQPTPSIYN